MPCGAKEIGAEMVYLLPEKFTKMAMKLSKYMYDSNGKLELDNWTATCCSGAVVWYGGVAVPMVLKQINDLRKRSGKSQLSFQILLMLEGGGPDDIREDYLIKFPERADLLCASTALDTPLFLNIITSCSSFLTVA